jgi:ABC-type branched-subunit amino acid transport system permease subunit
VTAGGLLVAGLVSFGVGFATMVGVGLYVVSVYPGKDDPRRNHRRFTGPAIAGALASMLGVILTLIAIVALLRGAA